MRSQFKNKQWIEHMLQEHASMLMTLPGLRDVVRIALAECAGMPCIKVFVTVKSPDLLKQIPSTIDGYTVTIEETEGLGHSITLPANATLQ